MNPRQARPRARRVRSPAAVLPRTARTGRAPPISVAGRASRREAAIAANDLDPVLAVRLRGAQVRQRIIEAAGGLLSAKKVSTALGISEQAVSKKHKGAKLLAVAVGNRVCYPRFQFTVGGEPLPGLPEVLAFLRRRSLSPWTQLRFFAGRSARLRHRSPMTALREGELNEVLQAAETFGEHGSA